MPLSLTCPACRHDFELRSRRNDKKAVCPSCRKRFSIPDDEPIVELTTAVNPACESCGAAMDAKAILCIHCGFNRKTGTRASQPSRKKQPNVLKFKGESYSFHRALFGKRFRIDNAEGQTILELKKSRSWLFSRRYEIEWTDAKTDQSILVIEKIRSGWLERSFRIERDHKKIGSIRFSRNRLGEPFNMIMKWNDDVVVDVVHREVDLRGTMSCGQLIMYPVALALLPVMAQLMTLGLALVIVLMPIILVLILMGVIPVPICRFRCQDDAKPMATLKSMGPKHYKLERTSEDDNRDLLIPMILSVVHLQGDLRVGEVPFQDPSERNRLLPT